MQPVICGIIQQFTVTAYCSLTATQKSNVENDCHVLLRQLNAFNVKQHIAMLVIFQLTVQP